MEQIIIPCGLLLWRFSIFDASTGIVENAKNTPVTTTAADAINIVRFSEGPSLSSDKVSKSSSAESTRQHVHNGVFECSLKMSEVVIAVPVNCLFEVDDRRLGFEDSEVLIANTLPLKNFHR